MFDLGSLLPSGPAAAAAGQAAPDILGSYNKGQMDFLALENALQNQQKQQRADLIAQQYLPIDIAVKNLKTIQDVNVAPGTVMPEVNPFDLESQMNYLKNVKPLTNAELDILKSEAQAKVGLQKVEATQNEINQRAQNEIAKDLQLKRADRANKFYESILEDSRFKNISASSSKKKIDALVANLEALKELGDPVVYKSAERRFGKILREAGVALPGSAAPATPAASPAAPTQVIPDPVNPGALMVESNTPPAPGAIPAQGPSLPPLTSPADRWRALMEKTKEIEAQKSAAKLDKTVSEYSKLHGLSYQAAENVLRKRGYVPK